MIQVLFHFIFYFKHYYYHLLLVVSATSLSTIWGNSKHMPRRYIGINARTTLLHSKSTNLHPSYTAALHTHTHTPRLPGFLPSFSLPLLELLILHLPPPPLCPFTTYQTVGALICDSSLFLLTLARWPLDGLQPSPILSPLGQRKRRNKIHATHKTPKDSPPGIIYRCKLAAPVCQCL